MGGSELLVVRQVIAGGSRIFVLGGGNGCACAKILSRIPLRRLPSKMAGAEVNVTSDVIRITSTSSVFPRFAEVSPSNHQLDSMQAEFRSAKSLNHVDQRSKVVKTSCSIRGSYGTN